MNICHKVQKLLGWGARYIDTHTYISTHTCDNTISLLFLIEKGNLAKELCQGYWNGILCACITFPNNHKRSLCSHYEIGSFADQSRIWPC